MESRNDSGRRCVVKNRQKVYRFFTDYHFYAFDKKFQKVQES